MRMTKFSISPKPTRIVPVLTPSTNDGEMRRCASQEKQTPSGFDSNRPKGPLGLRKKHKKTRNGCFTCKVRKIKCDETKPGCKRCKSFGFECNGYPKPPIVFEPVPRKLLSLVPKTLAQSPSLDTQLHAGPRFTEEKDGRYFRYYCEDIATQISGPFSTSVWQQIIPQAGELEPFIGHAIIALGALSMSRAHKNHLQLIESGDQGPPAMDSHHQYALIQYGKALMGMRRAIKNQDKDSRNALIACLLVFCFESIMGHQAAASAHASSAINLLYRWGSEQSNPIVGRKDHPSHNILGEDDLYSAFAGLDLQALLFVDSRPLGIHQSLISDMNQVIKLMPEAFENLKQCSTYWRIIMRRNFHFMAAARAAVLPPTSSSRGSKVTEDSINFSPGNNPWSIPEIGPKYIPFELLEERDKCVEDILRWERSSTMLFACSSPKTDTYLATTLLQVHAAMNIILLAHTFYPSETVHDAYLHEFRKIVTLSSSVQHLLVQSSKSGANFHFDIGILPVLTYAGMYCRNRPLRAQAIELLLGAPGYREGIWNSYSAGHICNYMRSVEEEFLDEKGCVPGDRRASMKGLKLSLEERQAKVTLRQGNGMGGFVTREKVLRW